MKLRRSKNHATSRPTRTSVYYLCRLSVVSGVMVKSGPVAWSRKGIGCQTHNHGQREQRTAVLVAAVPEITR